MVFDFERMQVYQLSLTAIDHANVIIQKMPRGNYSLTDQLRRAIASVSLNVAEGIGEFKPKEKARFYRMALRSASESCSIVQIAHRIGAASSEDYQYCYELLERISKMLTNLIGAMERRAR
jgi:four helix bundle protein